MSVTKGECSAQDVDIKLLDEPENIKSQTLVDEEEGKQPTEIVRWVVWSFQFFNTIKRYSDKNEKWKWIYKGLKTKTCNQYITYVFSTFTLYRYVEVFYSTVIKATQGPSYL